MTEHLGTELANSTSVPSASICAVALGRIRRPSDRPDLTMEVINGAAAARSS